MSDWSKVPPFELGKNMPAQPAPASAEPRLVNGIEQMHYEVASAEDGATRAAHALYNCISSHASFRGGWPGIRIAAEIIRQHCPAPQLTEEEQTRLKRLRGIVAIPCDVPDRVVNALKDLLAIIDRIAPGGGK